MRGQGAGLTPERMLAAYARGIFPMAETRDSADLHWVEPRQRGILPLDGFHVSRSLARRIRQGGAEIAVNRDFAAVVAACADRPETWINGPLATLYRQLHGMGHAHSLEVRREGRLVGGVFGVTLGRVFCGETMFSRETDASKVALAFLVDRLRQAGFALFDTQFLTPHLASLGGIEIAQADYLRRLAAALEGPAAEFAAPGIPSPQLLMQRMTQMS
ncbi:MAG: leucyl/phenylalanyl-tRNA--protein transferase [Proteobacteria bacterium]|nr:leucyl/phenylalanyl-tRNA--protein transferase [Pseudomonadota bacterium]MBS0573699.1 leucyl/phenylalanyl-tRNA--protein transferase [Pseudomonadota bacterium]